MEWETGGGVHGFMMVMGEGDGLGEKVGRLAMPVRWARQGLPYSLPMPDH